MTERMYTEQEVVQYMQRAVEAYESGLKAGDAYGMKLGIIVTTGVITLTTAAVVAIKEYRAKKAEEIY